MIVLIKKVFLTGVVTLFAFCSADNGIGWSVNIDLQDNSSTSSTSTTESSTTTTDQSFDLGNLSSNNHTCDKTTNSYDSFVTHHEGYDTYSGTCTNNETKDFIGQTVNVYPDNLDSTHGESPSQGINNSDSTTTSHDHDPLRDSTLEARKQEIGENQIAQMEAHNTPLSTGIIIYELTIPKGTILYLRDVENCTFDSTLILEKTHTIKDLIAALDSPIIKARFERLNFYFLRRDNPKKGHDHRSKNELQLMDTLILGKITQLLIRIMHSDLNIAQAAFDELKQLWPWKRDHTFLGRSLKTGSGESGFITNIGINIMKLAEESLITRPDYIAKHANAQEQKTIQEHKEKCYLLQQRGDRRALFAEKQQLQLCVNENSNNTDLTSNVCLAIAEKALHQPITMVLSNIRHISSLEKAHAELINLEIQILDQTQKINIIHTAKIKQWTIDHYGFDVLDAGQKCYKSRADYSATSEKQSLFSDSIRIIVDNIEHRDLPSAHAELVHLDTQVDKILEERNITDSIAQKEYIKKTFGKDVLGIAHKSYEARADHKELVESFMAIDVNQAAIRILENNDNYRSAANEMNDLAKHVFGNARYCNLSNLPKIESHVYDSIDAMRTAQDHPTFIFNFSMAHRTLGDIQQLAHAILSGTHPVLERSSELLIIGFDTFFKGLNPCTQASNMGHLVSDLGSFLKKSGTALWNDPITTVHNGITRTFTLTELIRNTADFASDLTVGKLYLSPEEYKQRTDAFCEMMKPLQGVTGDQCAVFIGQFMADVMFCKGLGSTYNFLKEIDVLGKFGESAATATRIFKKGFDTHLANNPIMVTAEGVVIKLSDGMHNIGAGGNKNVIKNTKTLFESAYTPNAIKLETEIQKVREFYKLYPKYDIPNFGNRELKVAYEHILGMELKWTNQGNLLKLGGFHHDLMGGVENSNVFKFINKVVRDNGCYKADIIIDGMCFEGKTFFPQHWPQEDVIKKIHEAYYNYTNSGATLELGKDGKYIVESLTNEGITIRMHITQKGLIKSAYPIIK